MIECTFDQILKDWAKSEWEEFADAPEFKTSKKHDRAMKRIFKRYERNVKKLRPRSGIGMRSVRRRIAIVVLAIIFAVLSGCTAAYFISQSFQGKVYNDNTELRPINIDNCPTVIEEKYYLSEVPEGFEIFKTDSDPFSEYICYKNEQTEQSFTFEQWVKSEYSVHYNTEKGDLVEVEINGYSGVLLDLSNDERPSANLVWDNGDYILELFGSLTKNDILELAKSAKIQ